MDINCMKYILNLGKSYGPDIWRTLVSLTTIVWIFIPIQITHEALCMTRKQFLWCVNLYIGDMTLSQSIDTP